MFAEHQPQLSRLGRSGPDGFERIATFALLTIRMPLRDVVLDYPLVRRGEPARSLFGTKHAGLADIKENARDYYELCERQYADTDGEELEDGLLHTLMGIPGIGPAKGGFIAQMIYGVSGCLDGHNLARFQIPETTFKGIKERTPGRRAAMIADYNRVVRRLGGTQALWDSWCTFMADRYPVDFVQGPDYVSALHLTPLKA